VKEILLIDARTKEDRDIGLALIDRYISSGFTTKHKPGRLHGTAYNATQPILVWHTENRITVRFSHSEG
jgi:hypothetical protein